MYHSPLLPFYIAGFILLLPFYMTYFKIVAWRCARNGGHTWENDWGSDTSGKGEIIVEYDYCEECRASLSRTPEK